MSTSTIEMTQGLVKTHGPKPAYRVSQREGTEQDVVTARQWPAFAGIVADLVPKRGLPARRARLNISFGLLAQGTVLWGARFWEEVDLSGGERVDWLLDSQQPVRSVDDALRLLRRRTDLVVGYGCC